MSQSPLFTRADILAHGASSDLLDGYRVRPIEVAAEVGGALGVATFKWRFLGSDDWSAPEPSEAGSTWEWVPRDPAFAVVTFSAATYSDGDSWTIGSSGTVTAQGDAPATVAATRTDVVTSIIAGVTSDIVTWCQPRVVPPILSLGEGQKGWAAIIAHWRLKLRSGVTPSEAGSGDGMLAEEAKRAEQRFIGIGASSMRPPDITDSSEANTGAGLSLLPYSESQRGW